MFKIRISFLQLMFIRTLIMPIYYKTTLFQVLKLASYDDLVVGLKSGWQSNDTSFKNLVFNSLYLIKFTNSSY